MIIMMTLCLVSLAGAQESKFAEVSVKDTGEGTSRIGVKQIDAIIMDTTWRSSSLGIPCFSYDGQKIVVDAFGELYDDNDTIYRIEYESKIVVIDVNEKKPVTLIKSDSLFFQRPQFSP